MKRNTGFTLIELLIVMSLIGMLAVIGLQNFRSSQMRGRDAVRKSDLRNIQTALRLYYNDYGKYPTGNASGVMSNACGTVLTPASCPYGQAWTKAGTTYMTILPDDPLKNNSGQDYFYTYVDDDNYIIRACLESKNDPKGIGGVASGTCTSTYKYEVKP